MQHNQRYGAHAYYLQDPFKDNAAHNQALAQVISVYDKSGDERAKHFRTTYNQPGLPPIWTLKEFFTFGAAARFYGCLTGQIRQDIAQAMGVPKLDVFDNWVKCFVDLRNACAHHDRLFNKRFQKQLKRLPRENIPVANNNTLKAHLECLDHVLQHFGGTTNFVGEVRRIIGLNIHSAIIPSEPGY